jgi:MFS family permease
MKKWGALITLSLAMFIIVIDTTIMNVSISALVADLNTTVSGVQSAISIYALVMAAFILIGGKLSDIFGKKRIFMIGLIIYGLGTTVASFSTSLGMLIVGWSIMEGIGGALMIPNIQVLLRSEYEGADLATAYGMIGAVGAVGAAVGPIVGGFFTTFLSWRWAFRTEVVIVVIVLILSRYLQRDKPIEPRPKFDFLGAGLSIFGWSSIVLGILLAQKYGFFLAKQPFLIANYEFAPFGLSITPILVGLGILLVLLLFRWEKRQEEKDLDGLFRPSIFNIPGIVSGFSVRFTQMLITAAFLYIFPLLLQLSFEFNAMETGVALMPFSLSLLVLALVGARISSRFFANRIIQVGFVLAVAGLLAIAASIQPDATAKDIALGGVFGAGLGLIVSQILNLILSSVSQEQTAETAGLTSTFEQLGNAIGVALVGTVMLAALTVSMQDGINTSDLFPAEIKAPLIEGVEQGIQLMSSTQLEAGLEEAGVGEAARDELLMIYDDARTAAFKAGVALLIFAGLSGLVLTLGLPKRKLVGEQTAVIDPELTPTA